MDSVGTEWKLHEVREGIFFFFGCWCRVVQCFEFRENEREKRECEERSGKKGLALSWLKKTNGDLIFYFPFFF